MRGVLTKANKTRRPRERRRNPLAAIATALVVLSAAPQVANAWTLAIADVAVTVPAECRPAEPDPRATFRTRCLQLRSAGSKRIVTRDALLAGSVNGRTPSKSNWVELVLNDIFMAFVTSSVQGSRGHSVKAAVVPAARLPRGVSNCKSYTIDQEGDDGGRARERGLFCAAWPADAPAPVISIAGVADLYYPSRGQTLPSDFDSAAARILASFRVE